MLNPIAVMFGAVGSCQGVAMWLLRYFGWLLGGFLVAQVCSHFLKKIWVLYAMQNLIAMTVGVVGRCQGVAM